MRSPPACHAIIVGAAYDHRGLLAELEQRMAVSNVAGLKERRVVDPSKTTPV